MKIRIKICCISSGDEARMAIASGASALGLVGHMPSGPGIISDAEIAAIARSVPAGISTFLLTSETGADAIVGHHQRVHTSTLQLVDHIDPADYSLIRRALPAIKIVQVIHVRDQTSVEEALLAAPLVDALLLDSGNPTLSVKELGGTGRTHNWQISRQIREQSPVPVYLAGGLTPHNVQSAIETVMPFGLDICSGVRTNGQLDPWKLEQFFTAINK